MNHDIRISFPSRKGEREATLVALLMKQPVTALKSPDYLFEQATKLLLGYTVCSFEQN